TKRDGRKRCFFPLSVLISLRCFWRFPPARLPRLVFAPPPPRGFAFLLVAWARGVGGERHRPALPFLPPRRCRLSHPLRVVAPAPPAGSQRAAHRRRFPR